MTLLKSIIENELEDEKLFITERDEDGNELYHVPHTIHSGLLSDVYNILIREILNGERSTNKQRILDVKGQAVTLMLEVIWQTKMKTNDVEGVDSKVIYRKYFEKKAENEKPLKTFTIISEKECQPFEDEKIRKKNTFNESYQWLSPEENDSFFETTVKPTIGIFRFDTGEAAKVLGFSLTNEEGLCYCSGVVDFISSLSARQKNLVIASTSVTIAGESTRGEIVWKANCPQEEEDLAKAINATIQTVHREKHSIVHLAENDPRINGVFKYCGNSYKKRYRAIVRLYYLDRTRIKREKTILR